MFCFLFYLFFFDVIFEILVSVFSMCNENLCKMYKITIWFSSIFHTFIYRFTFIMRWKKDILSSFRHFYMIIYYLLFASWVIYKFMNEFRIFMSLFVHIFSEWIQALLHHQLFKGLLSIVRLFYKLFEHRQTFP